MSIFNLLNIKKGINGVANIPNQKI